MLGWRWLVPAVAVVVAALYYQQLLQKEENHAVYVIGDLHGDVHCARHWVARTGLIQNDNITWKDPTSSLVFLGDYVDKGPTSRQTIEFVKSLTEQFPEHVTAIMGNHELELLLDRDSSREAWGKDRGYFQLPYAAAHPAEYLNYLPKVTSEDEMVVEALYNASLEVYGNGHYRSVFLSPDDKAFLEYVRPDIRELVKDRMQAYQQEYLNAFRSGTELGTWLEQRPILSVKNGALFVHGGVSSEASSYIEKLGVNGINELMALHAQQDKLNKFIEGTSEGWAIYNMLTYRGNHKGDACNHLPRLLPEGASMLGVGHTPAGNVRIQCNGNFLALDSALGRYFRNSGNEYCRGDREQRSSNGRFVCRKMNSECQGQIIRIQNGAVEVID